ncbi:hypothetical protein ACFWSF_21800 [Streptomyces sp. NPDC058611]|uniref:hypothetical protein n=1 Tax=unclassified Streptomyces TaxID=2593676 RepID=UPI0036463775
MARSAQHTGDTPADPAAVRWRITSGSPEPEEVAAVAVALSAAMAARIAEAMEEARDEAAAEREAARWAPAAARRRAATSWTAGTRPGWRVSH